MVHLAEGSRRLLRHRVRPPVRLQPVKQLHRRDQQRSLVRPQLGQRRARETERLLAHQAARPLRLPTHVPPPGRTRRQYPLGAPQFSPEEQSGQNYADDSSEVREKRQGRRRGVACILRSPPRPGRAHRGAEQDRPDLRETCCARDLEEAEDTASSISPSCIRSRIGC